MKEILLPQIKKWIAFALIGVTTYCAGYFLGKFYLDIKQTEATSATSVLEESSSKNIEESRDSEIVK